LGILEARVLVSLIPKDSNSALIASPIPFGTLVLK
jgi:hypothetical protein